MVGVSLARHTAASITSAPARFLDTDQQRLSGQSNRASFSSKQSLSARTSYRGTALAGVDGGKHADTIAIDNGRGTVMAASGPTGHTPALHVGRLWLKQAKAGQGKQGASGPKAKGNCRRLCPPTATVSIETRPLLQKPFTSVHTSPRPLPMHANDERSYYYNDAEAAHPAWLTYQAAIGEAHTSTEYALGISDRLATLAEYRMIREESLLNLQAIRMAAFGAQNENSESQSRD